MIRKCDDDEFASICEIINDSAAAYRGVIPSDRWHEPYMSREHLEEELKSGVVFWGAEKDGKLIGVMGIQDKGDVTLIRHAYIRTSLRRSGMGSLLLEYLQSLTDKPILIGTWAAATWAVSFYQKNGYRLVSPAEKDRLLTKYWSIPARQVETSVVLKKVK